MSMCACRGLDSLDPSSFLCVCVHRDSLPSKAFFHQPSGQLSFLYSLKPGRSGPKPVQQPRLEIRTPLPCFPQLSVRGKQPEAQVHRSKMDFCGSRTLCCEPTSEPGCWCYPLLASTTVSAVAALPLASLQRLAFVSNSSRGCSSCEGV